jgi:ABC-type phosphate transport system substrate-binding protein
MNKHLEQLGLIALIAVSSSANAQTTSATVHSDRQETISIKGVRFVDALLQKWISEYSKVHPEVALSITGKDAEEHSIEVVSFGKRNGDTEDLSTTAVTFGKYAVLPVTGKNSVLPDELKKKKLNEKRIKELFFERDILADDDEPDTKKKYDLTVYSGSSPHSVSHSFAGHFGYNASSLKGKKIAGDDIYLNSAVGKDVKGISFNALNYIFNIETRQLSDDIALLPLDVKKEYAEVLNLQNLDETIQLLENKEIDLIPVAELTFVLKGNISAATLRFLEWTLSEGQDYIHSFGFLQLDTKTLAQQRRQISVLETKSLAHKN